MLRNRRRRDHSVGRPLASRDTRSYESALLGNALGDQRGMSDVDGCKHRFGACWWICGDEDVLGSVRQRVNEIEGVPFACVRDECQWICTVDTGLKCDQARNAIRITEPREAQLRYSCDEPAGPRPGQPTQCEAAREPETGDWLGLSAHLVKIQRCAVILRGKFHREKSTIGRQLACEDVWLKRVVGCLEPWRRLTCHARRSGEREQSARTPEKGRRPLVVRRIAQRLRSATSVMSG